MKYMKYFNINENLENTFLYHGSNISFDEFDDDKISTGDGSDLFGKGYYLTDNIDVATFYAKLSSKKEKIIDYTNDGIFKSEVPIYAPNADKYANENFKINKFELNGNILDTYSYILDNDFVKNLKKSFKDNNHYGDPADRIFDNTYIFMKNNKKKIYNYRGELLYLIDLIANGNKKIINSIIKEIKDLGYDGLKYKPDQDFEGNKNSYNYVIYDKSKLKKVENINITV